MKKMRYFVVVYVTFCSNEKLSMPTIFCGLKGLGLEVAKIQWKSANRLKLRVGINSLAHDRISAVNTIVSKLQNYFKDAVVLPT